MKKIMIGFVFALALAGTVWAQPYIGAQLPGGVEPGIPDYSGCSQPSCELTCPAGAIQENEYCPSLVDVTNGGCVGGTIQASSIACDQTVCGTIFSRALLRDVDYYRLGIAVSDSGVQVCVNAEFPPLVALVQFVGGDTSDCGSVEILRWAAAADTCPCEEVCLDLTGVAPGDYYLVVTTAIFNCAEFCADYQITVDCDGDEQLPNEWDMGDLQACYPTEIMNPAHRITEIAWLGATVTAEDAPHILNEDAGDDGVTFLNMPWMPCEVESVSVVVTAGPNYQTWVDSVQGGGTLYLNAWKDGNLDCDFCDVLCDTTGGGGASEWIIQNEVVTPGTHSFSFLDPGVLNLGRYEGRLRFRLSEFPLSGCPPQATADVGEVEDYIIGDLQLAVELMGGLSAIAGDGAVRLAWVTASETNNDHFELYRDGQLIANPRGAGTTASRCEYRHVDSGLDNDRRYTYKLVTVDAAGMRNEVAQANAVPKKSTSLTATEFDLAQNYPNPFNPTTSITFSLVEDGFTTLTIYNLMGQELATLVRGNMAAGVHTVEFDAGTLPSGMYLYKLTAGSYSATRKMLLMK